MDKFWSLSCVFVALAAVIAVKIWQVCKVVFWRPYVFTKFFEKQGIRGPPYTPLYGSLPQIKMLAKAAHNLVLDIHHNDITARVVPHYFQWFKQYGEIFLYWYGTQPRLVISDPELAKQILSNKFGFYVKPKTRPSLLALIGRGLPVVNGSVWARHRRILNPAFSVDKLKVMVKRMAACTILMFEEWNNRAATPKAQCFELEMNKEFQKLTADIISCTSFGSNYLQGREAFEAQKELQKCCATSNADLFIPGSQYLPTQSNIKRWKLERKVKNSLKGIIEGRMKSIGNGNASNGYGNDLLGQMMGASGSTKDCINFNMDEIMDECKTFFFAGHETTSNLLTWTIFLISSHQEWQVKLRQEVLEESGMEVPDADMLAKLKLTNMVLLEALRLYCPILIIIREASEDMKLGNLRIPKGTSLVIPAVKIHRSKEYWGEDANDFNPLRFNNGVSKAANHPNALLAFSIGPRACIGQNFAMIEAKTVLALLLQRFSFSLSPQYKHMPANNLTLQPKCGLPVVVKPLSH